jgi:hypothetical protein
VNTVLREVTGIRIPLFDLSANTRRVVFFYRLFFWSTPIAVISVPERNTDDKYADISAAVRKLADDFGFRVIVDGSPNSIPPIALSTKRESVFFIEPMAMKQIESIQEIEELVKFLKQNGLHTAVWEVVGGYPVKYIDLYVKFIEMKSEGLSTDDMIEEVKNFVKLQLSKAHDKVVSSSSNTKAIVHIFQDKSIGNISKAALETNGFSLDNPNNVFREVLRKDEFMIEPATPAISLIIKGNIKDVSGVRALAESLFVKGNS